MVSWINQALGLAASVWEAKLWSWIIKGNNCVLQFLLFPSWFDIHVLDIEGIVGLGLVC
jgi:hypothetical protein